MNMHESLSELYARLAIKFRRLTLDKTEKKFLCNHCGKEERHHDPRCTVYVTSLEFRSKSDDELANVHKALTLIEQLREINLE